MEKIGDKIRDVAAAIDASGPLSGFVLEKKQSPAAAGAAAAKTAKAKIKRLFGREKTLHSILGGGKPADLFLWRDKKISAGVLTVATTIWVLFEIMDYHLLTLACHCLILSLAILFCWSNASTFINKSPPNIPLVSIPEDAVVNVARSLRSEINRGLLTLREIGSGRDMKKFFMVIAAIWIISILGTLYDFLTLLYIIFLVLYTVPILYEKNEDKFDALGEKTELEFRRLYAAFDEKCLSKIPRGPIKNKKI